jgi:hypothetical protein
MDPVFERNRQRLIDGMAAGLAATLVMTCAAFVAPRLGGARVTAAAGEVLASAAGHPAYAGLLFVAHLAYGCLAGGLFAVGARRPTLGRGALYGLGLWGVAMVVYAPLVGLGLLASDVPGLGAVLAPLHLLYGLCLAALGPRGEIVQPIERAAGSGGRGRVATAS